MGLKFNRRIYNDSKKKSLINVEKWLQTIQMWPRSYFNSQKVILDVSFQRLKLAGRVIFQWGQFSTLHQ